MAKSAELLDRLERAFGRGSERVIAECLIGFLTKHTGTSHINLQLMRQLTPEAASGDMDKEILRTLQFLAGDGIALLDAKFEILDAEEHPQGIEREEVKEALSLKVNPLTGEKDPDIASKIVMFFAPVPAAIGELTHE